MKYKNQVSVFSCGTIFVCKISKNMDLIHRTNIITAAVSRVCGVSVGVCLALRVPLVHVSNKHF